MSDSDPLRRYIEAGIALTQLTRSRAEAIVKELVKAGEVQREHAQERVDELVDRSRKGTGDLAASVRHEIADQLSAMGFATKADLAELEARLVTRFGGAGATPAASTATAAKAKATTAKATTAKATTAKATTAKATRGTAAKVAPQARTARATRSTPPPTTAAGTVGAAKGSRRRPGPAPGAGGG